MEWIAEIVDDILVTSSSVGPCMAWHLHVKGLWITLVNGTDHELWAKHLTQYVAKLLDSDNAEDALQEAKDHADITMW